MYKCASARSRPHARNRRAMDEHSCDGCCGDMTMTEKMFRILGEVQRSGEAREHGDGCLCSPPIWTFRGVTAAVTRATA